MPETTGRHLQKHLTEETPAEQPKAKEKRSKSAATGKKNGWRAVLIFLLVFALLLACILGGVWLFVRSKIAKLNYTAPVTSEEEIIINTDLETTVTDEATGETYTYDTMIEEEQVLPEGEAVVSDDIINVLLIGSDARMPGTSDPGRADVTMVVSLNKSTGAVKLISFERGIYVPVPGMGSDLLTHTFHWGGAELTTKDIEDCFLLDLAGYAHVDFDSFAAIIDAIGGVDLELTAQEAFTLNGGSATGYLQAGMNYNVDGAHTLSYCRLRAIDSNWQRIARQRNTIQAILNKTKGLSISQLNSLADTILPLVDTSLDSDTIMSLLLAAPKFLGATAEQYQVPEQNNSATIDFTYESARLQSIIYGTETEN